MKKSLIFLIILTIIMNICACNFLPTTNESTTNEKQAPIYEGMTVSSTIDFSETQCEGWKLFSNTNNDNNGNHNGQGDKDGLNPEGHDHYAELGEDVYINIHINNPEEFEILSFTLNGKKYTNYMFESGSDMETIIIKCNVGNEEGVQEYTIDAIKYVDGTKIKDVIIKGNKTISIYVSKAVFNEDKIDSEKLNPSKGLEFVLNEDGESYSLSGIGTCTDVHIVIPETYEGLPITNICEFALIQSETVESIHIPKSVVSVQPRAFWGRLTLKKISVDSQNEYYASKNGILYSKNGETLVSYPIGQNNTSFDIPNFVTNIADFAFGAAVLLESINVPNSVTNVGYGAFYSCNSLKTITIGNSVSSLGIAALAYCSSLTSVTIPSSVKNLGYSLFYFSTSLSTVKYEGSVEQWNNITYIVDFELGEDIDTKLFVASLVSETLVTEIVCSDGTVTWK